jgi:hypothetical protein
VLDDLSEPAEFEASAFSGGVGCVGGVATELMLEIAMVSPH